MTLVCIILAFLKHNSEDTAAPYGGASLFGMVFTMILAVLCGINSVKPTAIDVYQGKTRIKVTSVDGIPVDSVVVFKKENK
jgi:uncharacterized membrane protein YadS